MLRDLVRQNGQIREQAARGAVVAERSDEARVGSGGPADPDPLLHPRAAHAAVGSHAQQNLQVGLAQPHHSAHPDLQEGQGSEKPQFALIRLEGHLAHPCT